MAGTWLDTVGDAPNNWVRLKLVWAYDEGVRYRMGGTALERPADNNPHASGTPENVLWATGWTDANDGTIDPSSAYRGQTAPA
jgi:hypothetical protein